LCCRRSPEQGGLQLLHLADDVAAKWLMQYGSVQLRRDVGWLQVYWHAGSELLAGRREVVIS